MAFSGLAPRASCLSYAGAHRAGHRTAGVFHQSRGGELPLACVKIQGQEHFLLLLLQSNQKPSAASLRLKSINKAKKV